MVRLTGGARQTQLRQPSLLDTDISTVLLITAMSRRSGGLLPPLAWCPAGRPRYQESPGGRGLLSSGTLCHVKVVEHLPCTRACGVRLQVEQKQFDDDEETLRAVFRKSLTDLGLEYLDLYLIHFPISLEYVPFSTLYPPKWEGTRVGQGLTFSKVLMNVALQKLKELKEEK